MRFSVLIRSVFVPAVLLVALAGCDKHLFDRPSASQMMEDMGGGPEVQTVEEAMHNAAKRASDAGEHLKAAQYYEQLIKKHGANNEYKYQMANELRRAGQLQKAQELFELYLKIAPQDIRAYEGKGLTLLGLGEVDNAMQLLATVLKRAPDRWQSANGVGIGFSIKKESDNALKYFRRALEISPQNSSILNNIGLTLAIKEDYPRAIKALEMASKYFQGSDNNRERIDMNMAMVYGIAGNSKQAEKIAGQYLEKSELYNNMGLFAAMANDKDLAKGYLNMALTSSKVHYDTAWENLKRLKAKQ